MEPTEVSPTGVGISQDCDIVVTRWYRDQVQLLVTSDQCHLVSSNNATEQQIVIHMMIIENNVKNLFLFVLYLW